MSRSKPPLFVELCAGTAALSLRLAAPRAKPPVSRMGAKTGYAKAILQVLGLRAGIGADHYLWCEPDDGCRMLLYSYRDPALRAAAAEKIRSWKDEDPKELWLRLRAIGPIVAPDPDEVARWIQVQAWSGLIPGQGYSGPGHGGDRWGDLPIPVLSARLDDTPTMPATIAADARCVEPIQLPPGTIVYIDGPYQNTTGYQHDLDRAAQVELARRWHAAGAIVVMSEAEPITELEGWYTVDITNCRIGQKRTFSKQKREWLTMSHPPAWRPPVQRSLFAMAPA